MKSSARSAQPAGLLLALVSTFYIAPLYAAAPPVPVPPPVTDSPKPTPSSPTMETAVLAGGCFWGVQGVFSHVKGVKQVLSGYAGGSKEEANYEKVSAGKTAHAESVQIHYDPKEISYGQILSIFFSVAHNPTELNRQGPDIGKQYRSAIFYTNPDQQRVAQAYITQLNRAAAFPKPIMTQLTPLKAFYAAEDYHQDYLIHNPRNPYIVEHDLPKIKYLKELFPNLYQDNAVTVSSKK